MMNHEILHHQISELQFALRLSDDCSEVRKAFGHLQETFREWVPKPRGIHLQRQPLWWETKNSQSLFRDPTVTIFQRAQHVSGRHKVHGLHNHRTLKLNKQTEATGYLIFRLSTPALRRTLLNTFVSVFSMTPFAPRTLRDEKTRSSLMNRRRWVGSAAPI
jgi:hypothetical protein